MALEPDWGYAPAALWQAEFELAENGNRARSASLRGGVGVQDGFWQAPVYGVGLVADLYQRPKRSGVRYIGTW